MWKQLKACALPVGEFIAAFCLVFGGAFLVCLFG